MNKKKKEKAKKAINKMIAQEYAPKPLIYKVRLIDNEVAEIPVFAHSVSNGAFENWTKKEFELYETSPEGETWAYPLAEGDKNRSIILISLFQSECLWPSSTEI